NDNSNYNSILSQAKANKESKENSKISFANAFLKQNASKLNEIQNANSQTLARSEVLNSTNTTNTSNNTNFSISSKTSSPNYDISSEFKNSIYTLKYKQADISNTSTNTAYGYSVDKNGYMGSDFNKAAGLPEDFKIHKSTLDEIERFNQNGMASETSGNYYDSFDMASIVKSHYNSFNQVISAFPNNKTSFSEADLEQLPKGLNYGRNENKEKIVKNIFNAEQFHEAQAIKYSTMNLGMNLMKLDFSPQSMEQGPSNEGEFNPDMSVYPQNEDGSYSKEALFMSFLKSYPPFPSPNQVVLSPEAKVREAKLELEMKANPSFSVSLDDIMTGKVDFASLLKGYAQDGWLDASIYAMETGAKWQNIYIGNGGAWFDNQFNQAKANGWKASSESINSYVNSIMDRLNNLIGQTRV
ncbi:MULTISPECIES: Cj0814 family flagellar-dependent secreted protein, partial [unclassified Campylobacter]|uniref:Cj0814 family flagellar-dependent secreted protein n=1 Tax=unclassified Campylobacter TaxID=2593542 RepID=UPI000B237CB0